MSDRKIPTLADVYEISESLIRTSAMLTNDDAFERVLSLGEQYKSVGLTPVYYRSDSTKTIYVTSKEKIDRKYH